MVRARTTTRQAAEAWKKAGLKVSPERIRNHWLTILAWKKSRKAAMDDEILTESSAE